MGRPGRAPSHSRARDTIGWKLLGRFGPIGRLDERAVELGLERIDGHPLQRGLWIRENVPRVRLAAHRGPPFRLRLDLLAESDERPVFALEKTSSTSFRIEGDKGGAACVGTKLRSRLREGDSLRFAAVGVRWSSAREDAIPRLVELLEPLLGLAETLQVRELPKRLLRLLRTEPSASLRAEACGALLTAFSASSWADEARAIAQHDPAWTVRLASTQGLSAMAAEPRLRALVEAEDAPMEVRARALDRFVALGRPSAPAFLETLERNPMEGLRAAAARSAGRLGFAALGSLAKAAEDPSPPVRAAAAAGLTAVGPAGEPHLLRLLNRGPVDRRLPNTELDILKVVVEALGQVGTARSIPSLAQLSEGAGLYAPLSDAAQRAIHRIRMRSPGSRRGGLSLVPNTGNGALSETGVDTEPDLIEARPSARGYHGRVIQKS